MTELTEASVVVSVTTFRTKTLLADETVVSTKSVPELKNAITDPSELIAGNVTLPPPLPPVPSTWPSKLTLTRLVTPVVKFLANRSFKLPNTPLSFSAKSSLLLKNAITLPSALIIGEPVAFPELSKPSSSTLTNSVVPVVKLRTNTSLPDVPDSTRSLA